MYHNRPPTLKYWTLLTLVHPFQLIPLRYRRTALITLLLGTAVLGAAMAVLNLSLTSTSAPSGMWDLEMARTPERAQAIIASWSPPATFAPAATSPAQAVQATSSQAPLHAHLLLLCGFPFVLCYAPAMSMALAWFAERDAGGGLALAAAWTALLAGLGDAAENALLLALLQPPMRHALVFPIYVAAITKFALLLFSVGCLYAELKGSGRRALSVVAAAVCLLILTQFGAALYRSLP